MTDDNIISLVDREKAIFRARVAGNSIRDIAHEFHCSVAHVQAIVDRQCTPIDEHLRRHTLLIELERLDELEKVFAHKARNGDAQAAMLVLEIRDRRAAYLGKPA
jgi:orotate phosphoribosyltransferase